ncbi:MAG: 50S ribosomal protein L9 [Anaerolineales bacterium]|jgi:large subunit ribosomal protein L9|nr:50S ribosomal protein L9 [Anaerolineales bacterium]
MKILLLKDVYKLGRAGDVKKVANGYGRNYLIPQGLGVLATPGAIKHAERIRNAANTRRSQLNQELSGDAGKLDGKFLLFAARASETGRLYGSVTTRMVADEIKKKLDVEINHRHIEMEPLRTLGRYTVPVRLTLDLAPALTVIVHREGETPDLNEVEDEEEVVETVEETVETAEPVAESA